MGTCRQVVSPFGPSRCRVSIANENQLQLTDILDHGFTVIDVRSPAEFAEDHVPGAINLPALSNEERAGLGQSTYKRRHSRPERLARRLWRRASCRTLMDEPLKNITGSWRPLVYCWRGGQRSGSFASILTQIGWRAEVIDGGYQSYRKSCA
jgi:tRNA 2-selenouridine synthase